MSKSHPLESTRILLTDSPKTISDKIRSAVTDSLPGISYDPVNRPGTSNLLGILAACESANVKAKAAVTPNPSPDGMQEWSVEALGNHWQSLGTSINHAHLKDAVTSSLVTLLEKPRLEYERLIMEEGGEGGYLDQVAREGARRARELSGETLREVRRRVGLC
jgi:tryptophanyl-tRNA synthetase